ncbi:MAG: hypothetical protein ACPG19_04430 [Saprospiraceae bacterium]
MNFAISSFAQKIDEDLLINENVIGYVLSNDGDTIHGEVKISTRIKNQIRVKFIDNAGDVKTYRAKKGEIKGYGFQTVSNSSNTMKKWRHFIVKKVKHAPAIFGSKTVFLEIKSTGDLMLYSLYIQRNTNRESPYQHSFYIEGAGFEFTEVTSSNFDRVTDILGEECSKIRKSVGQLSFYDFGRIVSYYNHCEEQKALINTKGR